MEIIRAAGIDEIQALCGGACICATCHVFIEPDFLGRVPMMSAEQDELLSGSSNRRVESRLACQIPFSESLIGVKIFIAQED